MYLFLLTPNICNLIFLLHVSQGDRVLYLFLLNLIKASIELGASLNILKIHEAKQKTRGYFVISVVAGVQ